MDLPFLSKYWGTSSRHFEDHQFSKRIFEDWFFRGVLTFPQPKGIRICVTFFPDWRVPRMADPFWGGPLFYRAHADTFSLQIKRTKNSPKIPKYSPKHSVYVNSFEKFAWTSCDMSQETSGNCSGKKLFKGTFLFWVDFFGWIFLLQRRKKRTQPPPKENLLENFSGLKEKLSRPVVDTKNPIKTRKTISTTEIFPLWTPFFSAKKSSALEQGSVCFLFPSPLTNVRGGGEIAA